MPAPLLIADLAPDPAAGWFWPSLAIALLALAALGVWAVLRLVREVGRAGSDVVRTAGDVAIRVADGLTANLRTTFNVDPHVRIAGVTRSAGVVATRELVTVRQQLTRTHEWTNTRLWSTKKVTMTATFTVRAGFDLTRPIEIDVTPDGAAAEIRWPAPRILSVQIDALDPAREEAGWWNRVTGADRAGVQLEMQRFVEQDAIESGLLARAEAELRQWLHEQARPTGTGLRIQFEPRPALPMPGPPVAPTPAGDPS